MKIPDYVSPIEAYRAWGWDLAGLTSLSGECWRPGRPHTAQCGMALDRHQAPQMGCTCGIYATKDPESVSCFGIYGEVYLWGTVVEHELGWRAQFA